jgi:hypothetical protein
MEIIRHGDVDWELDIRTESAKQPRRKVAEGFGNCRYEKLKMNGDKKKGI